MAARLRSGCGWVFVIAGSILTAGCAERERLTGPPTPVDLDTETIGAAGGALEAEGFRLIVPPGAFPQEATLVLRDATATAPTVEGRVTPVYEIAGIPETIALPCSLEIATPVADPQDGSRWVRAEELDTYIHSADEFGRCPITLECTDEGTRVRALLPATPGEGLDADAPGSVAQTATGTMQVSVDGGRWSYVTPQGHFQILYDVTALELTAQQVGTELERAYAMLRDDLGLSWAGRTRRIKVTIQLFEAGQEEAWGLHVPSKWYGVEYDELILNKLKIYGSPVGDELKATLGHELFHLMQHIYDPRYRISQGKPNAWFWVNEAMSTWFERKMLTRAYVPESVREADYRFFLSHALQYTPAYTLGVVCNDCWVVQNHGYGASLFLGGTFEGVSQGDQRVGDILKRRKEGDEPIAAFQHVLTAAASSLGQEWIAFCTDWMAGGIYPDVAGFPSPTKIVEGRNDAFTFAAVDQSLQTFYWRTTDYSARLYMVYFNPSAGIPLNAPAVLSYVDEDFGCEVIVYGYKRDTLWQRIGTITTPGKTLTIPNIGEYARDGKGLAILTMCTRGSLSGHAPAAVQVAVERCDPGAAVVLNGTTIPETKITRTPSGCVARIDLSYMNLSSANCLDGIDAHASGLEELILHHNSLAGVDLTDLGHCTQLRRLDLRYNGLQAIDLDPLGSCKKLEMLDLVGNQLQSLDLEPLAACPRIRELRARDNQITGLDLAPLAAGDSLRTLVLSNNYLTGIDLTPLASLPKLQTLEMNHCYLDVANLGPLAGCPDLYFIAMGENSISTLDLTPLADHTKLEFINFNSNQLGTVNLAPLASCPALRSLGFVNNNIVTLDLGPLNDLPAMRWLELEQNYLDGNTCGQVCNYKSTHPGCSVTSDCGCAR